MSEMFEHRVLEKMRIGLSQRISPAVAASLELDPNGMEQFGTELALRISGFVLGENLGHVEEVARLHTPATWWQHWKHSHAPAWFKRRYPVVYQWVLVNYRRDERITYPHARVMPTAEWGVGVMSWKTTVDYDINPTGFELDSIMREPEQQFLHKRELVSALYRTEAVGPNPLNIDIGQVLRLLDGLNELGVNPNQLVLRQNEKF